MLLEATMKILFNTKRLNRLSEAADTIENNNFQSKKILREASSERDI